MDDQDANLVEPMDVIEDKELLEGAREEVGKLDVLVCGGCHEVFHFVDEIKEHRSAEKCPGKTVLTEEQRQESKHQIWAFMLWKNSKFKDKKVDEKPSSWTVYQQWCNLNQDDKEKWIIAAQKVQYLYKLSKADNTDTKNKADGKGKIKIKSEDSEEEINEMEVENTPDPLAQDPPKPEKRGRGRPPLRPNRAIRSLSESKIEHLVEKITAKRYQPRIKAFEYLVKWENCDQKENTWEPAGNLNNCKRLLDEFERKLEEMRRNKAAKLLPKGKQEAQLLTSGGRPQRSSKQRAMNQVKQWVGTMSDNEDGGGKRHVFSDSEDSDEGHFEKRLKLEENSSDSETERPQVTIKKLTKGMNTALNNGKDRVRTASRLPDNILVPDANGVVRINQKQLPNLSTGVYVMSKTAGIIKLDSDTSKIAASGGHAVIKVAPRIGQTSIKIIRKDAQNGGKITTTTTKVRSTGSPSMRPGQPQLKRTYSDKRLAIPGKLNRSESTDMHVEDESDGLEELEFPTEDTPIPEPESPPGDFTLCPLTGKIAGQEYPVQAAVTITSPVSTAATTTVTSVTTVDNLVSLAAADILQEASEQDDVHVKEEPQGTSSGDEAKLEQSSFKSSILSTALTNANIPTSPAPLKKVPTLLATPQDRRKTAINKGIISRTITPRPSPQAVITRITPGVSPIARPRTQVVAQPRGVTRVIHQQPIRGGMIRGAPPPRPTRTIVMGPRPGGQSIHHHQQLQQQQQQHHQQVIHRTTTVRGAGNQQTVRRVIRSGQSPGVSSPGSGGTIVRTVVRRPSLSPTKTYVRQQPAAPTTIPKPVVQHVAPPPPAPVVIKSPPPAVSMPSLQQEVAQPQEIQLAKVEEQPLLITGEDGTIYQVAGQNEDGQTILITQGEDGEQQCLLVASENMPEMNQAIAAATSEPQQQQLYEEQQQQQQQLQQQQQQQQQEEEAAEETDESQVVAQIVSAQPPSPGGTRKVVLMLPDGNFMMTEVTADQYAALELDK